MEETLLNSNLTIRQQATFKGALLRFWLRVRKGMLLLSESRMALVGLALFSVVVLMVTILMLRGVTYQLLRMYVLAVWPLCLQ